MLGSSALGSDTEEEEEKRDEKHEEGEDSANEREEDVEVSFDPLPTLCLELILVRFPFSLRPQMNL